MSHFKQFCDAIPKNKNGYVPDLLDMDSDHIRDQATVAYLKDMKNIWAAETFNYFSDEVKGDYYRALEILMQDAIDAYNQAIDDAKDARKMTDEQFFDFMNPYVKSVSYNQAEIDAGFSGTGKEFC